MASFREAAHSFFSFQTDSENREREPPPLKLDSDVIERFDGIETNVDAALGHEAIACAEQSEAHAVRHVCDARRPRRGQRALLGQIYFCQVGLHRSYPARRFVFSARRLEARARDI